jgi:competence protein ComEC
MSTPSEALRSDEDDKPRSFVDLRLAPPAAGAWLVSWWCLRHGAGAACVVAALAASVALAAGIALLALAAPRRQAVAAVVAGCALGALSGALATAPRLAVRDAGGAARAAASAESTAVTLTITDDPHRTAKSRPGSELWVVPADLHSVGPHRTKAAGRILVLAEHSGWSALLPGQSVSARGRFIAPRGKDLTAAVLQVTAAPVRLGHPAWHQRVAGSLRAGLRRACTGLPDAPGGLLPGLAVGDTSRLDPALRDSFKTTGLTHLTAVSGANLAIVAGLVLVLAGWARAGPGRSAAIAALAIAGFVVLVRPSPSVVRAAAMCGLGLLALALGRPRAAVPALCLSIFGLVLYDPALAISPGFALSVAATGGLLLIAPGWARAMRRRRVPAVVAEALAVPAAAQVVCAPLLAVIGGSVSLVAVPANLLAGPAVAPATVLGLLAALTSPVSPTVAACCAWLGGWPARWLVFVADRGARVPLGAVPWPVGATGGWLLTALLIALAVAARWRMGRSLLAVTAIAVSVAVVPVRVAAPGWPPQGWFLIGCDVGQGDALVLRAGPSAAVVVDAGPEPEPVDRCLRRIGVSAVPLLVITHLHLDHVGGIDGVLRRRKVGAIGVGAYSLGSAAAPSVGGRLLRAAAGARRTPVVRLVAGVRVTVGSVALAVIGPVTAFVGTRSDPNNNSVVLRAEIGGVSVLLPGDAEREAETALLGAGVQVTADVLKVPHHGSAYNTAEFLAAVRPRVAVIEVGTGNDYGHPSMAVVHRLQRQGTRVLRTDQDGDVAVIVDSGRLGTVVGGQ